MAKRGAKNKYFKCVKPYLQEINEKVRQGVTEEEIAKSLGISVASLNNYRNQYDEFREALSKDKGTDVLNELVNAGIEAAVGTTRIIKKPVKLKRKTYDQDGKLLAVEEYIDYIEEEVYLPPNAVLNQFYVLNFGKSKGYSRDPLDYELKKDKHDLDKQVVKANNWDVNLDNYK